MQARLKSSHVWSDIRTCGTRCNIQVCVCTYSTSYTSDWIMDICVTLARFVITFMVIVCSLFLLAENNRDVAEHMGHFTFLDVTDLAWLEGDANF